MKQVVFAVFLIAMASLTGCLNEEDSSDTTIYTPSKNSIISLPNLEFYKNGNTVTSNCKSSGSWDDYILTIADTNSNVIWTLNGYQHFNNNGDYGWEDCPFPDDFKYRVNINLPQEPVRISAIKWNDEIYIAAGTF